MTDARRFADELRELTAAAAWQPDPTTCTELVAWIKRRADATARGGLQRYVRCQVGAMPAFARQRHPMQEVVKALTHEGLEVEFYDYRGEGSSCNDDCALRHCPHFGYLIEW